MNLALSIVLTWLGCALLWVAFHGIDAQDASPRGVLTTVADALSLKSAKAAADKATADKATTGGG